MTTENQITDNESFDMALAPEPIKRKRSSILRQPDKRTRDSRTVSFNDKYFYKELYQDGTCDITNFFLGEDMDITMMDIIDPIDCNNQTIDISADMSVDHTIVASQCVDITLVQPNNNHSNAATTTHLETTLDERDMISVNPINQSELQQPKQQQQLQQQRQQQQQQPHQPEQQHQPHQPHQQPHQPEQPEQQHQQQQQKLQPQPQQQQLQLQQQQHQQEQQQHQQSHRNSQHQLSHVSQISQDLQTSRLSQLSQISEISSLDDTLFGAFHDSNNLSMASNRSSGVDTLMHNIEALNDLVHKVEHDTDKCRRRLDAEIQDLFNFYRHIVNKNNPYEFAIAIFGLRHSLWLIIKINPDTYPNEKLNLRFAVNKRDRQLYPFKEYAEAVRRYTKGGGYGYLKRFVVSAQMFRRFLKKIGYGKTTNSHSVTQSEK